MNRRRQSLSLATYLTGNLHDLPPRNPPLPYHVLRSKRRDGPCPESCMERDMTDHASLIKRLEEAEAGSIPVRDKFGVEIKVGDVLKVFHFVGPRRKRHYMYKQVVGVMTLGVPGRRSEYLKISHLNMDENGYYTQRLDGSILDGYEVVQGAKDNIEDRPRILKALQAKEQAGA